MKHCVLRPAQCQPWTCIKMRASHCKTLGKEVGLISPQPDVHLVISTADKQQNQIVYKSVEVNPDSILFLLYLVMTEQVIMKSHWNISPQIGWFITPCWCCRLQTKGCWGWWEEEEGRKEKAWRTSNTVHLQQFLCSPEQPLRTFLNLQVQI